MIHFKEYVKPTDLSEAYKLNQAKSAVLAGGFCFLRTGNRSIKTLIDLSGVLTDGIEELHEAFRIGAMTTLRDLENHEGLNRYTNGAVRDSVKRIVGTQFRNLATVGGSIFGRYGFSDVLTCFLAMDVDVELYKGGQVPLHEFAGMKKDDDILTAVIVKKADIKIAYEAMRNEAADFPVLSVAVAEYPDMRTVVSVGACPARAKRVVFEGSALDLAKNSPAVKKLAGSFTYGTNMRASKEYREYLAGVLIARAAERAALGRKEEGVCN